MRTRTALALTLGTALAVAGCSNATSSTAGSGSGAPGVSAKTIMVGSIANITGIDSSDFASAAKGVQAYFDMVNATGGVFGRQLKLAYTLDDQGTPPTDTSVAQELVEQHHVFAVVGVGTPFFAGARYLAQQGTPTFGYVVSSDWDNHPTLFGAYGSFLDFNTVGPIDAYVLHQLHATSVGVVAYGVPQSVAACQAAATGFRQFGIPVTFTDMNLGFGADPTADVLRMRSHHVDLLYSCLDVSGNVGFARAFRQNGVSNIHEIWLNGYDRTTLQQYGSLMGGVIFQLQHVPFEAATAFPGVYPGMAQYLATMQRYEPTYTYDEVALDGYVNAAQFVAGLRAVGPNLTQAKLVAAINQMTAFTGDGLTTPVNWTNAHSSAPPPWCAAFVAVKNGGFEPTLVTHGHQVFACFAANSDQPVTPPAGTPGT